MGWAVAPTSSQVKSTSLQVATFLPIALEQTQLLLVVVQRDTLLWNPALKVSPCVARLWEWGDYVRVTQTTKLGARERGREWRALVGAGTHQTSWKSSFSCAIPQKSEINCKKDNQQRNEIFCCILIISFSTFVMVCDLCCLNCVFCLQMCYL